ncbi:OTUD3 [Mytilus coruscus]|uniref:OTUD3 n=1 Tax=Mytilus coruscus TaxID=42192 RepID=A0A6J8DAN4_MYTCO|nr:OTUD3 [Mytilus coruscus]
MDSDIDWSDWSDTDLKAISETIDQETEKTETSTTTENSTDTQDTIITSMSTSSTAYNAVCNKKKPSTVSDKSSDESDPDDSIPLINVTKNKQRLKKQALKAEKTLNNLLLSNNLKRVPIAADGNCFLKAVLHGLQEGNSDLNVEKMQKDLVKHLQHERAHYNNFLSFDEQLAEEEKKKRYDDYLHDLSHNGHWNSDLADMMPLALSNIYRHPIRVYSSKVANSVYNILPGLGEYNSSTDFIKVALSQ